MFKFSGIPFNRGVETNPTASAAATRPPPATIDGVVEAVDIIDDTSSSLTFVVIVKFVQS
jgi:hypothetical protein